MKKILMGALSLLLIAGAAQAQDTTQKRHHGRGSIEQLNLTADQKAKLKTLREAQQKERAALKNNPAATEETRKQRRELQEKYQAQMKAILTPKQQARLAQSRAAHSKEGQTQRGTQFKKGKNGLDLTETQQAKMKTLNKAFQAKRENLRNNPSLTEAQKKEEMKAIAQQHRTEIKSVLTTEQQQKLETMRKERRGRSGK